MKLSRRAKRMEKHHKRMKGSALNLVSLMDIFTILLFFLLINQEEVQNLQSARTIKLPESLSDIKPRQTYVITVTDTEILLQGVVVLTTAQALAAPEESLPTLRQALSQVVANRTLIVENGDAAAEREVTIMGDKAIPYKLLKKIMVSCTEAKFNHISLAVTQKPNKSG
jgi:biopolymer transport protein ExbD